MMLYTLYLFSILEAKLVHSIWVKLKQPHATSFFDVTVYIGTNKDNLKNWASYGIGAMQPPPGSVIHFQGTPTKGKFIKITKSTLTLVVGELAIA